MAAGGGFTRLDSALLAKWPEQIDIQNDIFIPGKTEAFKSSLVAALKSRMLLQVVVERAPTLQDIARQNPTASGAEVQDAYDMITATRHKATENLANLLPQLIKQSSLTYVQSNDLMALVSRGDGVAIYAFILRVIDLRFGAVQDKLQSKYNNMKVSNTDSIAVVSKQIDLKWFLHKNHVLFNVLVESGRREGIRNILKMLLDGPGNVGTEAILSLSQVDLMDFTGHDSAENWVKVRLENYQRYGDLLVGSQGKGYMGFMGGEEGAR